MAKAGGGPLSPSPATPTAPSGEITIGRKRGRPRKHPLSAKEKTVGSLATIPDEEIEQPRRWKNAGNKNPSLRISYDPHPKQVVFGEAIKNGAKIVLFLAGIRSGKSFAGSFEVLKLIYEHKRLPNLGYIVTPTVNMGRIPRRLFINAAGGALLRYKRASDDGPPNCQMMPFKGMPKKAYIVEFHSGEHPDRLRGAAPAWAWLDEAAFMKPEVFDIVLGRVMENDGVIIVTTSPSTKAHWTYTEIISRAARCGKCRNFYHDHKYIRVDDRLVPNDHEPTDLYCETVGVKPDTSIAVIQCATFDNTHLKRELIQDLKERYSLKDPIIARRELYGEVCGFEGLVYRSFERDTHRSDYTSANVPDDAEIVAGIDFGVNDPFVVSFLARVKDAWHVVDEYYWQGEPRSIKQHVDEMKRRCRLFNRVKRWWYDPSGKQQSIELQQCGLRNLFKARKRFATGQSWIRFRIDTVNALLLARDANGDPLLRLSRACPGIIGDFETRKWKRYTVVGDDDRARVMDQKGKEVDRNAGDEPAPGYDHGTDACLRLGTLISTLRGEVPIESITQDDYTLTRDGYRRVTWAGLTNPSAETYKISLSNGASLYATANHPVWSARCGWSPVSGLQVGDALLAAPRKSTSSSVESTGAILTPLQETTEFTSRVTDAFSTAISGCITTARSRTATSSTTETAIRSTTLSRTLSRSRTRNMRTSIGRRSRRNVIASTFTAFETSPLSGTRQRLVSNGTGRTPSDAASATKSMGRLSADGAGKTSLGSRSGLSIAAPRAESPTTESKGSTISVVSVERTGLLEPVYNISVEGTPEYFANGVLVHNCEYALVSEVIAGRYQIKSKKPVSVPLQDGAVLLGPKGPEPSMLEKQLSAQMASHAESLHKMKATRDAWSFRPRWS